jgi:hypothetical protein
VKDVRTQHQGVRASRASAGMLAPPAGLQRNGHACAGWPLATEVSTAA